MDPSIVSDELRRQRLWFLMHLTPRTRRAQNQQPVAQHPSRVVTDGIQHSHPQPLQPSQPHHHHHQPPTQELTPLVQNQAIMPADSLYLPITQPTTQPMAMPTNGASATVTESGTLGTALESTALPTAQSVSVMSSSANASTVMTGLGGKGKPMQIFVSTASGASYQLQTTSSENLSTVISRVQQADLELSVLGDKARFVVLNSRFQKLVGSKEHALSKFKIKHGDRLHVRLVRFPPFYSMIPLYQNLVLTGNALALMVFHALLMVAACILLIVSARLPMTIGHWWSDALDLTYNVPFTLETLVIAFISSWLGVRLGLGSLLLYWVCILAGIPSIPGSATGAEVLYGPAAGYVWGFGPAIYVGSWLCGKGWDRGVISSFLLMFVITTVIYVFGFFWLPFGISIKYNIALRHVSCGFGDGCIGNLLMWGVIPYLFGDLMKFLLGLALLPLGWRAIAIHSTSKFRTKQHEEWRQSSVVVSL